MLGKYSATEPPNKGILRKDQTMTMKTKSDGHSWAILYSRVRFLFFETWSQEVQVGLEVCRADDNLELELLILLPPFPSTQITGMYHHIPVLMVG